MDLDLLIESEGLYCTTLPSGISFVWRLLTEKEYRVFRMVKSQQLLPGIRVSLEIFNRCYQGDHRAINGNIPAGIFLSIGELIYELSGGSGKERDEIGTARQAYPDSSVNEVMKRIILMAFPSYTPDVFSSWTRPKLLRTFVIAESVLQNKIGYEPIDLKKILTPEEAAAKSRNTGINTVNENRSLEEESGDTVHPLDMDQQELVRRANKKKKLDMAQAKRLDRMEGNKARRTSRKPRGRR